jgi:hypothetical protein
MENKIAKRGAYTADRNNNNAPTLQVSSEISVSMLNNTALNTFNGPDHISFTSPLTHYYLPS